MASNDAARHTMKTPERSEYQVNSSSFDRASCNETSEDDSRSEPTVGQFSFAPATQTTIVTTTTTTTTSFPPLVMKAPRPLDGLDPKHYPLASSETPLSLRDIKFNLNGQSIVFHESDHAASTLTEQQEALSASDGVIRSVAIANPLPRSDSIYSRLPRHGHRSLNNLNTKRRRVSPVPTAESSQDPNPSRSFVPEPSTSRHPRRTCSSATKHPWHFPDVGLATPETESANFVLDSEMNQPKKASKLGLFVERQYESPCISGENRRGSLDDGEQTSPLLERRSGLPSDTLMSSLSSSSDIGPRPARRLRPLVSRLVAVDGNSAENLPLPSPRLSPIAAANASQQEVSFDSTEDQTTDTDSNNDLVQNETISLYDVARKSNSREGEARNVIDYASSSLSLMDMPVMLSYFESIPDELKSYVMYQLLKRCPKQTLHVVADVVNPALKCDFLALLPFELSLNIVKFLDVQSMCRASQVSKKWRHIINSDEKTWKAHFDAAGFNLPEAELQQAIEEGWAWQYSGDFEQDLRLCSASDSESLPQTSHSRETPTLNDAISGGSRKLKRKAVSIPPGRGSAKKQLLKDDSPEQHEIANWIHNLKIAEGPYAAANAAALALPYPEIGLPSLRSLHLYKSLYQRHHSIRKMWMDRNAKPLHIAFRAHDRHVVTCLQFDTDKILTGSDDTNIHVYDTKTGAIKSTLEGHEGGVWALEYHGNTLVSGSTDRSVRVWDIEKAECTQTFQGHTSTVRCLKILLPTEIGRKPDGTIETMPKEPLIITGSRDSSLRVWRLPQPGDPKYFQAGPEDDNCPYFIRALNGHTHSVRAIAAHGDTLVSGSYDCTVRVWKISTGEVVHRLEGHSLKVYSVVLDHQRNRCISGSMDHFVKIWSLETGSLLYNLEGHALLVGLLDLQADKLVSAAADSTLRIWDPETGHCKNILTAHTGAITCFEHDEQKIISGSDRTLKMWNIKTGECFKDLLTDLSCVWQVRFNERRCVAAVQRNGRTYIEVLDFGASRDRVPADRLGRRIVVDSHGKEIPEANERAGDGNE
ncbi:cell division control protein 4 [Uncinocarpus reesii 1704]|uniref:Probable E3 ubiquitin ligase complex SCF subunit sconB n=1 Tax=Uncinocarpus reesii (strain UAMH 1704) TaxID=336963 RepID=C4JSG4_UNCRE|nr:cell division control protein 4 [Uncinocarpus reesii 1704]EEP80561.1 cell division control protein 4 [Uncinocarpus reesii 1704]